MAMMPLEVRAYLSIISIISHNFLVTLLEFKTQINAFVLMPLAFSRLHGTPLTLEDISLFSTRRRGTAVKETFIFCHLRRRAIPAR